MTIKRELPEGKTIDAVCAGRCGVETEHSVLAAVSERGSNEYVEWWGSYKIICCQGCKTISFREGNSHSEDFDYDEDGKMILNETVKFYPQRIADARGLGEDVYYLPSDVIPIYTETRTALVSDLPVLTGIGLRALLEAICNEQKLVATKLFDKLNEFVSKGVLTKGRAETLHRIRDLGNDAAHETKGHTAKQLAVMMNIIEHLIGELYILPAKTAEAAFPPPKPPQTQST